MCKHMRTSSAMIVVQRGVTCLARCARRAELKLCMHVRCEARARQKQDALPCFFFVFLGTAR